MITFASRHLRTENFFRFLKTLQRDFSALQSMSSSLTDLSERYCYDPSLHWNPQVVEYFVKAYGADHFGRISKALTHPCCYSCIRVNILKTTSDSVIEKLTKLLHETSNGDDVNGIHSCEDEADEECDVRQIREGFSNGLALHDDAEDYAKKLMNSFGDAKPVCKCPIPGLDYVVFVRGSGPHQLEYDCTHGKPPKEVIVSRKCAESVLRGAQVYVPGVLACSAHVEKGENVAVSVAVEQREPDGGWSVGMTRGMVLQGLQTDPQYIQRKGMYIGQGTAMMSRAGIFRVLEGLAINMTRRVFDLPSLNNVLEGEIFLQNLPSIITAQVLDPQQGERILDMCAAPGGKTTAIAMLMKDVGEVVAVDRSHNKVQDVLKLATEMGLKSITAYKLDALKSVSLKTKSEDMNPVGGDIPSSEPPQSELVKVDATKMANLRSCITGASPNVTSQRVKNGPGKNQVGGVRVEKSDGFSPNSFDRVLLDAPCSALGLRPRLFAGEETLESLRSHGKYQRRMLDQAVQLVRPGGVLVYSTCTINPGENEALVRYALDTYKFLSLAPQQPRVGGPGLVGCNNFSDGYVEEWLRLGEEKLVQRFDPSVVDTIGFFIAKFSVGPKDC